MPASSKILSFEQWLLKTANGYGYHCGSNSHQSGNRQRWGQWLWNEVEAHRPDITERLRASHVDPFYNDTRVGAFLTKVEEYWPNDTDD